MPEKTPSFKIKRARQKQQPLKTKKLPQRITDQATNIPDKADAEVITYTIGYENYRSDICEINNMSTGPLRKIIEYFKMVGLCTNPTDIKSIGFNVKEITDANHYQRYFNKIRDEDVELKELVAGGSARHFFYIDPAKKVVQIVAHINTHTETKKQFK